MARALPGIFIAVGLGAFALAVGFFLELPWAFSFWPWPAKKLGHVFISSIFAAIGAPILWMGMTREWAAVAGGAFNLAVAEIGIAWLSYATSNMLAACIAGVFVLACLAQVVITRKIPFLDTRKTPMPVRVSFGIFAVLLIILGLTLITRSSNVFPWPVEGATQSSYGWIFLGAATYFIYANVVPVWGNAQGQLAGFLAYDIVLIVPYIQHLEKVSDALRPNLIVYIAVLTYSGLLAAYYLFVAKGYRLGSSPSPAR